jgi:hypothetical protein
MRYRENDWKITKETEENEKEKKISTKQEKTNLASVSLNPLQTRVICLFLFL